MKTILVVLVSVKETFIDDEFLAIAVPGVAAGSVLLIRAGAHPLLAGRFLFTGSLLVLALSILRTAGRK